MDFIYNMSLVLFGEKECKFYTEPENAHPQRHTHTVEPHVHGILDR